MAYVKKGYSWLTYVLGVFIVWFCASVHLSAPTWAEEVVKRSAEQESIKALNRKVDLLIEALSEKGRINFDQATKEELEQLNKIIDNPIQSNIILNPGQPMKLKENPRQGYCIFLEKENPVQPAKIKEGQ